MNTTEFLSAILPRRGVYLMATMSADKRMKHKGFTSIESAAKFILEMDQKGEVVYHACAAYNRAPYKNDEGRFITRTSENWNCAKAFWIDIDCGENKAQEGKGYATKKEAVTAIGTWCTSHDFPPPMVVSSGNGLHIYWTLTDEIPPHEWIETATALKTLLLSDGILADPSRTADFASVLRPVGTFNRKDPNNPKAVRVVCTAPAVQPPVFIKKVLDAVSTSGFSLPPVPDWMKGNTETITVSAPQLPCSIEIVANHCAQVAQMRDTKGDVGYDHWRGVIGLIKHSVEGIEKAIEWTANRQATGHTNVDVETRYNTWGSGPTTCAFFESCNPSKCANCPHRGNIKSPIMLGKIEPKQTDNKVVATSIESKGVVVDTNVTVVIPKFPSAYTWDGHNMVRMARDPDGVLHGTAFCPVQFYLFARIQNEDGVMVCKARAHLPQGKIREFDIPGSLIGAGGSELLKLLGSHEVVTDNHKDAGKYMHAYLKEFMTDLTRTKSVTTTHTSFGWKEDGKCFLIGSRLYRPDGSIENVLLTGHARDKEEILAPPKGSLDAFKKSLNWVYNREGMQPMQYMICSLIASPLVNFCEPTYNGIPFALTGVSSGKGKSTAAMVGLYAYGQASPGLCIAGVQGATAKAQSAFLGTMSNLPVLFDEITNMDAKALSNLCYGLSNGVEIMRLRSGNGSVQFANREEWRTHTAVTGNTCIWDRLLSSHNAQAEAMRIFEVRIDEYNIPELDPIAVSAEVATMERNRGTVGHAFIQYIVTHNEESQRMLVETLESLKDNSALVTQPQYRFFRNHVACTLTAAKILKDKLGIIEFDVDKMKEFATTAIKRSVESNVGSQLTNPIDIIKTYLTEKATSIVTTERFVPLSYQSPYQVRIQGTLVGRGIHCEDPKLAEIDCNDRFFLLPAPLKDWCVEKRVDVNFIKRALTADGVLLSTSDRRTISKGLEQIAVPQARVWVLDWKKIMEE